MGSFTNFLNLFKRDVATDIEEEFDIDKTLNENWDKLDTKVKEELDKKISKSGDTMTGPLVVPKIVSTLQGNADTSTRATKADGLTSYHANRTTQTTTWTRIATLTIPYTTTGWAEYHAIIFVKGTHNTNYTQNGILAIDAMTQGSCTISTCKAQFINASSNLSVNNFYIEYKNGNAETKENTIVNLFINCVATYSSWDIRLLTNYGFKFATSVPSAPSMPEAGFSGSYATLQNKVAKLAVAKNIALSGAVKGNADFDGSASIDITTAYNSQILTNEDDLNNIKKVGVFHAVGGNTVKNKPDGVDAFGMFVLLSAGSYYTQILVSGNVMPNRIYLRRYADSKWWDWEQIYSSKYFPVASTAESGMVKVGTGLSIENGVLRANSATVIDNLNSDSGTSALSAKQRKGA